MIDVAMAHEVAHEARVDDYLRGGKANFQADREVGARQAEALGGIGNAHAMLDAAPAFLHDAVGHLVAEGVNQFLDIGCGIPDEDAAALWRQAQPGTRVVHVDNDPLVLAHAHLFRQGEATEDGDGVAGPDVGGRRYFVQGDLRSPQDILGRLATMLDLDQPVGTLLGAVLHFLPDEDDPQRVVQELLAPMASGSYLVVSHLTADVLPRETAQLGAAPDGRARYRFHPRTRDAVQGFFDGLHMDHPGVRSLKDWLDEAEDADGEPMAGLYHGGIGRKP